MLVYFDEHEMRTRIERLEAENVELKALLKHWHNHGTLAENISPPPLAIYQKTAEAIGGRTVDSQERTGTNILQEVPVPDHFPPQKIHSCPFHLPVQ
jgi:hypothetical protein